MTIFIDITIQQSSGSCVGLSGSLTGGRCRGQLMVWLESLGNLPSQRVAVSCVRDDEFAGELRDALVQLGCYSVDFAESSATHAGVTTLCNSLLARC